MLNEERVKLMTKLALYEEGQGKEDIDVSAYYRKDYSSFHTLVAVLWITVGYVIAVGLGVVAFMGKLMNHFTLKVIIMLAVGIIIGYLIMIITYVIVCSKIYQNQHTQARQRVKLFNRELTQLNKLYEREKR
ncbi:MAG: hypothetical protein RSA90_05225 [Lachnospiraceae bacterium]